jgi:hypothetical protein
VPVEPTHLPTALLPAEERLNTPHFRTAVTIVGVLLAVGLLYLAHHTRVESFYYKWYPGNTYPPLRRRSLNGM